MADKTKITKDWSNADQFLRERYEPTKKYVDAQINPEFVYDETAVSCKTIPENVKDFAVIEKIYGKTIKEDDTLKSAPIESVVSLSKNLLSTPYTNPSGHKMATNVVVTYGNDGIIYLNGTPAIDNGTFMIKEVSEKFAENNYKFILENTKKINVLFKLYKSGTQVASLLDNVCEAGVNDFNIAIPDVDYDSYRLMLRPKISYGAYNNDIVKVMLTADTSETEFVPYNKTTISVPDSIKNLEGYGIEGNWVDFENGKYHRVNKINAAGTDVEALTTPQVIDISDIIRPIKCETGGTITLVNEHSLDVANTIIYEREVSEHD